MTEKKRNTLIFMLLSSIADVLMTLVIIAALCVLVTFVLKMVHVNNGQVYIFSWMACFIAGIVIAVIVFARVCSHVIERFNLVDKLDERALGKYLPNGKRIQYADSTESSGQPKKRKTVMPDSVLPKDEADPWNLREPSAPPSHSDASTEQPSVQHE